MKKLSLIVVLALAIAAGFAQDYPVFNFTATYTFGADGNVTSFDYNGTEYSGITMGPMVKVGVTSTGSDGNFRASGWPIDTWSQSGYYMGFTISAVQGYKFTVNTIEFGIGRDATGTRFTEWRGSGTNNYSISDMLSNYTTVAPGLTRHTGGTYGGLLENPTNAAGSWTGNVLTIPSVASYQNVTTSCGFRIYLTGSGGGSAGLDGPITVSGTYTFTGDYPAIEVYPKSLTGFTYEYGSGPSPAQTFTVTAAGLPKNQNPPKSVLLDPPDGYELSSSENGTYHTGTYSVPSDANGYVAPTTVYVRLRETDQSLQPLAVGNYIGNVEAGYYLNVNPPVKRFVALSGEVTDPTLPVELSHFSATMTAQNYVQLTWVSQTETNLMGYNVYRSDSDDLSSAAKISDLIGATNTSNAQTYIYYDMELDQEGTHYYWLQNVEMDGSSGFHGPASVFFTVGGNGGAPSIPKFTRLENAYPNPFNPSTTIRYQLKDPGHVKIGIYNTRGQLLQSLERNHSDAGHYGFIWNGCDSSGRELPSGVYLYRMSCGRYSETKKMVLQK